MAGTLRRLLHLFVISHLEGMVMEGYQLFQRHILYLLRSSLLLDSRWLEQVIEGRHLDFSCAAPHAHITSLVKAA